jgi:hypothetical protein
MAKYIKYVLSVNYEDNSYGKTISKTQVFEKADGEDFDIFFARIEKWRYDNGYILRTPLSILNCTSEAAEKNI